MLEKDPAARPQSMLEIVDRLATLGGGRPAVPLTTAIMSYGVDPSSSSSAGQPGAPSMAGRAPSFFSGSGSASGSGSGSDLWGPSSVAKAPTPAPSMAKVPTPAPSMAKVPTPAPGGMSTAARSGPSMVSPASPHSGHVMAGGTRVMPAGNYTTMSDSAAEVADQVDLPARSPRRSGPIIAAAGGLVALVVVGVIVLKGRGPSPGPVASAPTITEPAAPPPAPAAPATPPPAPSTDVTLEVQSDPPDAEVWLATDKAARGKTPFRMTVDRKGGPTHVILKARGYADKPLDLDPQGASPVVVTLEKTGHGRDRDTATATATATATDHDNDHKPRDSQHGTGKRGKDSYKMMGD
jgi:hypothetical protein